MAGWMKHVEVITYDEIVSALIRMCVMRGVCVPVLVCTSFHFVQQCTCDLLGPSKQAFDISSSKRL